MSTTITYKGSILRAIVGGQTATLNCKDKKMLSNVVVSFGEAGTITYDGKVTPVSANKKATLICANQKMLSNVIIYATSEVVGDVAGLFDTNGNSVATWTQLESIYGLLISKDYTRTNYKTEKNSLYKVIEDNTILSSGSKLKILDKVSYIGAYSVAGCDKLIEITIPNSVTSIGSGAFSGCNGLNKVHITDIEAWCNISFAGSTSQPLERANYLYLNNELVTDLVIPDTVTQIKQYTFYFLYSLQSVTIPNSIEAIGSCSFCGCTYLKNVTIPNSVKSIGAGAFNYNYQLTTVTIEAITPPTLEGEIFSGSEKLTTIFVPDSAYDAYTSPNATNWTNYAAKIKRLSEKE